MPTPQTSRPISPARPHQQLCRPVDVPYANVGALFAAKRALDPAKPFLTCPGERDEVFSYEAFNGRCEAVGQYLSQLGLGKGTRINIIFPNSPEFLIFYVAALTRGITVVPINSDLAPREMQYIIADSSSKAIFYHRTLGAKIDEIRGGIAPDVCFVGLESVDDVAPPQPSSTVDVPLPEIGLEDEAIIIYTSGTTGNPKGVVLSHLNLLADAKAISEWFRFSPETRTLCLLPLFHNNGQITTFLAPLYAGGSTVVAKGKANVLAFWDLVNRYRVSWSSVMPSILSILLRAPIERKDTTLVGILCGGQVLNPGVQDQFERRFKVPIFEGYGLTETTSFSCINDFPEEDRKRGSIGRPLHVNEMAVLDEAGRELGPHTEGEICIRGYNVACEYLGLPERNRRAFADGWFHSGDYGTKDEDGYFCFRGRRDFLIIKGGENIYPAELENVLYQHPAVGECAVIGIPDALLGEEVCAFVKRKDDTHVSAHELKSFCRGRIAPFKQAKHVIIVDELPDLAEIPKGPTKKVLYGDLKEYYLKNAARLTERSVDQVTA